MEYKNRLKLVKSYISAKNCKTLRRDAVNTNPSCIFALQSVEYEMKLPCVNNPIIVFEKSNFCSFEDVFSWYHLFVILD